MDFLETSARSLRFGRDDTMADGMTLACREVTHVILFIQGLWRLPDSDIAGEGRLLLWMQGDDRTLSWSCVSLDPFGSSTSVPDFGHTPLAEWLVRRLGSGSSRCPDVHPCCFGCHSFE